MTFRLKVERGERVSYANIRKEAFQAREIAHGKMWRCKLVYSIWKQTNKQNKYMEGRGAGADGDGERRRGWGQRRSRWDHRGCVSHSMGLDFCFEWDGKSLWSSSDLTHLLNDGSGWCVENRWLRGEARVETGKLVIRQLWSESLCPPESCSAILTPKIIVLGGRGLWVLLKSWGWGLHEWDSCLVIRIPQRPPASHHGRDTLGRVSLPEPSHAGSSSVDFSGPRTGIHPFLLSISCPGCGISLQQP